MKTMITTSVLLLMCIIPGYAHAQWVTISGYVTHAITGSAIENASVFEKHSEIGTISNKDGFFKLMLHPGHQNISFAEDGFKTISESIVLKSDTSVVITLKPVRTDRNRHKNDATLQAGIQKNNNDQAGKQN